MTDHDNDVDTLVSEYHRGQIDRRELLRRAALLGLSASVAAMTPSSL